MASAMCCVSSLALALPELCLQSPRRTDVCPHLLFKKSNVVIPALKVQKHSLICVCLSDINPLMQKSQIESVKIDQQVGWKELTERYQLNKEAILALIRE
jgi:hypothetical protein